jgi:SAM-dependent methyltransferase
LLSPTSQRLSLNPAPMTVHGWLRYDIARRLLPRDVESVLEIGAGKGALGSLLAQRYGYLGLEPDQQSFEAAKARLGDDGVVMCLREQDYSGDPVDLVCAFEVLEHIEDDIGDLQRWRRHLHPGGSLIVSVPAGRSRFGPTDERQGHFRRYDRRDLVRALSLGGFEDVCVVSYGFPIGRLLLFASNFQARRKPRPDQLENRTAESGRWMQPSRGVARRLVAAPAGIVQRPFAGTELGTGFVARGRLPLQ